MREIIKCSTIPTENDDEIEIELIKDNDVVFVMINGEQWFVNRNLAHATIMFELLSKHITEYIDMI